MPGTLTPSQEKAVQTQGNTLVVAGAGTGKTRTLVARCVDRLLDPNLKLHLDQFLVVTFTEAAAAEIRQRIRNELEQRLVSVEPDVQERISSHLAGLETASISTLHSFCLSLVKEHFHELAIDPQLLILSEEQAAVLAQETLESLFDHHYERQDPESQAVQQLLQDQVDGWEERLRDVILAIHRFTQTRPNPEGWFDRQFRMFNQEDPVHWKGWLVDATRSLATTWLPILDNVPHDDLVLPTVSKILNKLRDLPNEDPPSASTLESARRGIRAIRVANDKENWPKRKMGQYRDPVKKLFDDMDFLGCLVSPQDEDPFRPLLEDWEWSRQGMRTLVTLAREFHIRYARVKRERGLADFNDLEQFSLKLLWDFDLEGPTELAREWRKQLKHILVDEYQDINEAQDKIITALGGEGPDANRFLVGDVKQSIYRFRQAAPAIFQNYAHAWTDEHALGQSIWLSDNFRSHEGLLTFINPFFSTVMRTELGGVVYDERAELIFGNPEGRAQLACADPPQPRVEVHLHLKEPPAPGNKEPEDDSSEVSTPRIDLEELADVEREALIVARRLKSLHAEGHTIWDPDGETFRPATWKDMVILMRAPGSKVESYAKIFARIDVPLHAKRTGFFKSTEVSDLISILKVLDNPLEDEPVLAVLRSPLVGLTIDELAEVRLCRPKGRFWLALQDWHGESENTKAAGHAKIDVFLKRYLHWRAHARHASLVQRLEQILAETCYLEWLMTQPRGQQRQANVAHLLALARDFDEMHSQGLHRFLRLIEAQQSASVDLEPASEESEDAVRLMSIHQSKGLEFPVVVIADMGKAFLLRDHNGGLQLDDRFGLCPNVRPPGTRPAYPSLPLWLAGRHQRQESLAEELRLLYVAMTRAQDTLILTGSCTEKAAAKWQEGSESQPAVKSILEASRYLDWLGPWLTQDIDDPEWFTRDSGQASHWRWQTHRASDLEDWLQSAFQSADSNAASPLEPLPGLTVPDADLLPALEDRLNWEYPNPEATHIPAKASVTSLRRQSQAEEEEGAEASPSRYRDPSTSVFARHGSRKSSGNGQRKLNAAERGRAHHTFLQWVDLDAAGHEAGLQSESDRLLRDGKLTQEEATALDLASLNQFWQSKIGVDIRKHASSTHRELPFTCRLDQADAEQLALAPVEQVPEGEFIIVQGVADLVVLLEKEIWLLDFKTDKVNAKTLPIEQYRPQIQLYAMALEKIHGRPVTRRWLHFLHPGISEELTLRHEGTKDS